MYIGVDIPTLSNCHKFNGQILSVPFRAFTVLSCGHILHRTYIQEIIMGTEAKCPAVKSQRTQSNTIILQDDQTPPPTAPIQSQSNRTNDEQDREPAPLNKVQGLITELSTPTKGESDDADENEIPDGSLSQGLARLYQKAIKAEKRVTMHIKGKFGGVTMRKGLKNGLKKL
ncbi:14808_t:CDS:2 [Acaulospora morrowiae]|uniref:14808_t:CDS:1 n=1 Tax=Acaulospora morrowiae TaxID=94023 RepID=A0A9N9C444_9GLOM|nr:14808_t:CDS:2 [Acaulospora morrowiae]